ncbi:MAG TPA: hypothetical protein VGN37_18235 [Actinocatenispora sp.]
MTPDPTAVHPLTGAERLVFRTPLVESPRSREETGPKVGDEPESGTS